MQRNIILEILNPAGRRMLVEGKRLAPRLGSLNGKRAGLVYNQKSGGDVLLARTAELLKERFKDLEVTWFSRACCKPPPEGYIADVVKGSDFAVAAAAD
jgi:hypothetical protein